VPERRVAVHELEDLLSRVFEACDMAREDAMLVANILTMTDLRGVHSHGAALAPQYVGGLRSGAINPHGRPYVVRDHGAAIVIDGDGAMGHLAATVGMQAAIGRARDLGIGAAAVRGTNHCGAAGHYARLALEESMIGLVFTTAVPTMAPAGGSALVLGMNPVGIAIPSKDEPPVVLDAAFAVAARGRVVLHAKEGRPLPEGWALDRQGNPTVDPEAALQGLLQPIAGYKGSGLAVTFGLLATALSGASFGTQLGDLEHGPVPGGDGLLAVAIDPAAFDALDVVLSRVDASTRTLRESKPQEGVDTVRLPGDRATMTQQIYGREGIAIADSTATALVNLCTELGVDPAPFG
jgi:LDH2 family malate/lactate/ureidoglycolate dehydrogenase